MLTEYLEGRCVQRAVDVVELEKGLEFMNEWLECHTCVKCALYEYFPLQNTFLFTINVPDVKNENVRLVYVHEIVIIMLAFIHITCAFEIFTEIIFKASIILVLIFLYSYDVLVTADQHNIFSVYF